MLPTQSVNIRLPVAILEKVKPLAEIKGLTPAAFIKTVICEHFNKK